MVHVYLKVA